MRWGGALAAGGGIVAALSVLLLPWATVSIPSRGLHQTVFVRSGSDGVVVLALAGLLIAVGGLLLIGRAKRAAAVVAVAAGLLLAAWGIGEVLLARDSVLDAYAEDVAAELHSPVQEVRSTLETVEIAPSAGVFGSVLAGAVGLMGGFAGILAGRKDRDPSRSGRH